MGGALYSSCAALEALTKEAGSPAMCAYQSALLGAPQGIILLPITGHHIILANANARAYMRDLGVAETAEAIRACFLRPPVPYAALVEQADIDSETRSYRYANYFFDGTHLLFIDDVTDRKRYESITAGADMENTTTLLLSSIRHELDSPVKSLKRAVSALLEDTGDLDEAGRQSYLERAVEQIKTLEVIVDRLHSYRPAERATPKPLRLDSFLSEFCGFVESAAEARGVAFSYVPFPPGIMVLADRAALQQALRTIIANAFEAMEGVVGASLAIKAVPGERYVTIVIKDTGLGLSPGTLRQVFTPLFTTKDPGAGLSLSLARSLVLSMSGDIGIQSDLGVGTVISVALQRSGNVPKVVPGMEGRRRSANAGVR